MWVGLCSYGQLSPTLVLNIGNIKSCFVVSNGLEFSEFRCGKVTVILVQLCILKNKNESENIDKMIEVNTNSQRLSCFKVSGFGSV